MLAVCNLSKSYGPIGAVQSVSFTVAGGEAVGLLGRNGAGKTTTFACILGLATPDAGDIEIDGIDARRSPRAAWRKVGAVLQENDFQDEITPREALRLLSALHGVADAGEALLARFGLREKAQARYATLSGGEKQRLALASALVHAPRVIMLDEPGSGLDPIMRRSLHDLIRTFKAEGRAVLLATHDLEEAASVCDRVAIIEAGHIVCMGAPRELATTKAGFALRIEASAPLDATLLMEEFRVAGLEAHIEVLAVDGAHARLRTSDVNAALAQIISALERRGVKLVAVRAGRSTLEDILLSLTDGGRS